MTETHGRTHASINGNGKEDEGACKQVLDWHSDGAKTQNPLTQSPGVYFVGELLMFC
jgi:hypothetical protein